LLGLEQPGGQIDCRCSVDPVRDTFTLADRTVRRLGYGAMQLCGPGVFGPPRDRDEAIRVLRRAVEVGINHIDTAQYYGPNVANKLICEALYPYPDDLALVSKVGAVRDDKGNWLPAQSPAELRAGVEDNLRSMRVDRLTAVNLRLLPHPEEGDQARVPLEDQLGEMVSLRDEGKIAGVGISSASPSEVEMAIRLARIVCVQNPFSLIDQGDVEVLERCTADGIAYVPFFPLGSAFPSLPKVTDQPAVQAVASRLAAQPSQVGLAWLLARADNVLLIPGTSSVAHLEENMRAADLELSEEDLAELSAVASPAVS
jgi:aryl-alcohol dehydrogenase-like predicted oxidoreductase